MLCRLVCIGVATYVLFLSLVKRRLPQKHTLGDYEGILSGKYFTRLPHSTPISSSGISLMGSILPHTLVCSSVKNSQRELFLTGVGTARLLQACMTVGLSAKSR